MAAGRRRFHPEPRRRYGNRTGLYQLGRVCEKKDYRQLIHTYFGVKLPNIKIAVTGSGRVAHGLLEIMNLSLL